MDITFNKRYWLKESSAFATLHGIRKCSSGEKEWIELHFKEVNGTAHFLNMDNVDKYVEESNPVAGNSEANAGTGNVAVKSASESEAAHSSTAVSEEVVQSMPEASKAAEAKEETSGAAFASDAPGLAGQAESAEEPEVMADAENADDTQQEITDNEEPEEFEQMDLSYFFKMEDD